MKNSKNIIEKNKEKEVEERFISPLSDTTFKRLWKDENSRKWFAKLIRLITNVDLEEYQLYDTELNSGNKIKDYNLDILFVNEDFDDAVNIEMYKEVKKNSKLKSSQYVFRLLAEYMKKGEDYRKQNVIQVNFYNSYFEFDKTMNMQCYKLLDETGKYSKDYLKIYDIYLPSYKGLCYNEVNELDAMLSFLNADSYEEMERVANGNKEALELMKSLEELAMEEKFVGLYNVERENRIMQNTAYAEGKEEGREEGIELGRTEGMAEGEQKKQIEIAKKMISKDIPINEIIDITGLTRDEIEKLN